MISGGGTGGHIFPALAIAEAIKAKEPDTVFLFVGAKGKMEMEKVPRAGYAIEGLWISGLQRKLTWNNLLFPFKLMSSLLRAYRIVQAFMPDVVVGTGGFASGPILEVASRKGVPTLIQEQNAYAGLTNKLLAKKVDRICVAYPGMEKYFPAEKIVETGNPVRKELSTSQTSAKAGRISYHLAADKATIVVIGGSLGAKTLNESLAGDTELLRNNPNVQVLWQCGKIYYDTYRQSATAQLPNVTIRAFLDDMAAAYAAADVVICRAGALTIAELCLLGKAAILVPSPNVAEDHQTRNAQALEERKAAILVTDSDAPTEMLARALQLIRNEELRQAIAQRAREMAHAGAAERIASEVLALAETKKKRP